MIFFKKCKQKTPLSDIWVEHIGNSNELFSLIDDEKEVKVDRAC